MASLFSDWKNRRASKGAPSKTRVDAMTGLDIPASGLESPYLSGRREWNERYGSYIAHARTWQIVAVCSMGLSAVLAFSLVNVANQAKVQPFVVQVDKLGEAVAVRPADVAYIADERIVRFQVANFIKNARSITPDRVVQKRWLDSVYAVSSPSGATFLNDYYRQNDPFEKGKTSLVSVDNLTALPLSDKTWQVTWTETTRGLNGLVEGVARYQAILTLSVFPPTTAEQIIANPTGIVFDTISWTSQM